MGLVKAIKLERQKTVTTNWYTSTCFPEILQEVNIGGLMFHHANALSHLARLTKTNQSNRTAAYSSDLAVGNFWLVFDLKKNIP